jgi:hypothetical protein
VHPPGAGHGLHRGHATSPPGPRATARPWRAS